jgi:hypothetical protein
MTYDLSILIPARNEMFLSKTVDDLLSNIEGNTEIIVGLDGVWANPPLVDDKRVSLVFYPNSIGQRGMTNQLARLSTAKYLMKVDAHCAFDKGFDVKMMAEMHDDWTMIPTMRNLHVFDWVCAEGHRRYQGPSGNCGVCGKPTIRDVVWIPKRSPQSNSYCFDAEPHFQYFNDWPKRPEGKGEITETMSIQGSFFMVTRDKYWELNLSDEAFGSWGSQGIEVACKTWLTGGKVMVNHKTWYAHLFRTQGGDFGFPYEQSGKQIGKAKNYARELFFEQKWNHPKWDKKNFPLSKLVTKFWPVKGWTDEDLNKLKAGENAFATKKAPTKGIIYFTDNQLNLRVARAVQKQLRAISAEKGIPIVSASLKPMGNMGKNIYLPLKWGRESMWRQILAALEGSESDIIFFCEHDVLYHPSHFDFTPPKQDVYYYNHNVWKVRLDDDFAIHYDANMLLGLCCYRDIAIKEYKERVRRIAAEGWNRRMGYEPGTRGIYRGGFSNSRWEKWHSELPLVDIKHGHNLTTQRWRQDQYKDAENCTDWKESTADKIPGWPNLIDVLGIKKSI